MEACRTYRNLKNRYTRATPPCQQCKSLGDLDESWLTDLGDVLGGEEDAQAALEHLGDGAAGVAPHRLDALGVKHRGRLLGRLVHEPHIALLGQQHTRMIHLQWRLAPEVSNHISLKSGSWKICNLNK